MQRATHRTPGLLAGILFLMLLLAAPAHARYIYMYKDDQGKVHYSDYLSGVPPQYRSKARAKYVPDEKPKTAGEDKAAEGAGGKQDSQSGKASDEQVGLTKQQEQLMMEAKTVMSRMIALEPRYRNVPRDFTNGQRMYQDIQSNLPVKQALVDKLAGAKHPLLKNVREFVQNSIAIDRETGVGAALQTHIQSIYLRFASEAKKAENLIEQIDQAIMKSRKEQAEAQAQAQRDAEKKKQ